MTHDLSKAKLYDKEVKGYEGVDLYENVELRISPVNADFWVSTQGLKKPPIYFLSTCIRSYCEDED